MYVCMNICNIYYKYKLYIYIINYFLSISRFCEDPDF